MAKQTMGKDENGVFHPGKGKPSGVNKEEGLGIQGTAPEKMDEYLQISDKYTVGEDELDPSVHLLHPNRNTSKGREYYKERPEQQEEGGTDSTDKDDTPPIEPVELPGILDKDSFKELANFTADCCISFYINAHPSGVEVNEHIDPIHFKNLLQDVNQRLLNKGYTETFIQPLLQPGYELLKNDEFWKWQSAGLALFAAPGIFQFIRMPLAPEEDLAIIQSSFYVSPLIPAMMCKEYFYLLVISKKSAKLFRADAWGMTKVDVALPQGIDEVKRLSDLDATTFRSGSTGARAPKASQEGTYHGVGGGNPDDKDNMLVYFEAVDDIIWDEVLHAENAPLLLAAVEYEIPIYKSACDYHNVWPEALTGSREHQDTASLYQDAKQLMQPYFNEKQRKALTLYMNNSANAKTSSIAADVIPAAYYSQLSHLFVKKGAHLFGTFNEADNKLDIFDNAEQGGEDMIDNAVVKTLANGGEVYLLPEEKMPAPSDLAAIFRF